MTKNVIPDLKKGQILEAATQAPAGVRSWFLPVAAVLLILLTPLGKEGTHPVIFLTFRSLLIGISTAGAWWCLRPGGRESLSLRVLATGIATGLLFLLSILRLDGTHFTSLYWWYNDILFFSAFLGLTVCARSFSNRQRICILLAPVAAGILHSAPDLVGGVRPILGTFINPNYLASYLIIGVAVCVAVLITTDRWTRAMFAAAAALLLLYAITAAWSRGATVACAAVAAAAALRYPRWTPAKLAAALAAVIVIGGVGYGSSSNLARKFTDTGQVDPYNYARPVVWRQSLRMIAAHPLLGVGMGEFHHAAKQLTFPVEGQVARYLKRFPIAHNEYLQYAAEGGIPAALLLFGLLAWLFWRTWRDPAPPQDQVLFKEAAILTATGLAVHALVDNNWAVPVLAAALPVFAVADVVPRSSIAWPTIQWSRPRVLAAAISLAIVYVHSTGAPFLGLLFNEIGHQAFQRQDLDRAEVFHQMANAAIPGDSTFLDNAGLVYRDRFARTRLRRDLDAAERHFRLAAAANPRAEEPWLHLETVLIQSLSGDVRRDQPVHQQIIETDSRILSINPSNPFVRSNLAEALFQTGQPERARAELLKAIEFEPNYVAGYLQLSGLEKRLGRLHDAEQFAAQAIAIAGKYQTYRTDEPYEVLLLGRKSAPEKTR